MRLAVHPTVQLCYESFNMTQLLPPSSQTFLHVIFNSNPKLTSHSGATHSAINDHLTKAASLDMRTSKAQVVAVSTRSFRLYDTAAFSGEVVTIPWRSRRSA